MTRNSSARVFARCLVAAIISVGGGAAAAELVPLSGSDESAPAPLPRPYRTARDAPLDATQEILLDAETHAEWRVEFHGINADRVPGILYLPKGDAAKSPAVLLQYGVGGHKQVDYIVALGRQFARHGFVVLTIDAPGRGERRSKEKKKADWFFSSDGRDAFLQYCGDYSRSVDYLETRPEVDRDRIAYVGISWGAITGVTYVAHDSRIKAMGSMVGGGNFIGIAEALSTKPDEAPREPPVPIDPARHVARIAPRPLLLLNVTRDQLVPRPFADALHQAAGEGAKKVWLDTDHYFSDVDRDEVGETVIRFIAESLAGGKGPP